MALTEVDTKGIKNASIKLEDIENGTSSDAGKFLKNNDGAAPSWAAVDTSNITVATEETDTTCHPVFVTTNTGQLPPKVNNDFTFNANTGYLSVKSIGLSKVGGATHQGTLSWVGSGSTASGTYAGHLDGLGIYLSSVSSGACSIRFGGNTSNDYVGFKSAGSSLPSGTQIIWQLPTADGSADQVLKTNGSAVLSWTDAGSGATGGGTEKIFWENGTTIDLSLIHI